MVEIVEYRKHNKESTLCGWITVKMPKTQLEINGISHFVKGGAEWIQLPRKDYLKKDGSKGYNEIIRFTERSYHDAFQKEVLEALSVFIKKDEPAKDEDVPF
jgi:hypothetical protein